MTVRGLIFWALGVGTPLNLEWQRPKGLKGYLFTRKGFKDETHGSP